MTDARLRERRFRTGPPRLRPECRLCWRSIDLAPGDVEVTQQHVYVRCPHCGGSFPIRHSDMDSFLGPEVTTAG